MYKHISEYVIVPVLIIAVLFFINKGEEHKVAPSIVGSIITIITFIIFLILRKFTDIRTGILVIMVIIFWIGMTILKNMFIKIKK